VIELPSDPPLSLPCTEHPQSFAEFPLEDTATSEVSSHSDTSQTTPSKDKDDEEGDWLEMATNGQSSKTQCLAGRDTGLIEISDDQEYRPYRGQEFFFPGRLIGVDSDTDSSIHGHAMIVLSVSDHGFVQCLSLCRHEGHTGEERGSFYKAHVAVHRDTTSPPTAKHPKTINPSFEITLKKSGHNIKDSCYINFEHTWTLLEHVPVVDLGYVRKSQRKDLLITHGRIQNELRQRTMEVFELK
jgi:hypothetical protein